MIDIERIARHRLDIEPSRDLEARIVARLDAEPVPRRRRAWPVLAIAGGVMTAAVLIAVQVSRSPEGQVQSPAVQMSRGPEVQESRPEVQAFRGPEVLSPASTRASSDISATSAISAIAAIADIENAGLSPEELAWMERRLPALPTPEPLTVETLEYESIQPEALAIAPLIMTALPAEPLGTERHH